MEVGTISLCKHCQTAIEYHGRDTLGDADWRHVNLVTENISCDAEPITDSRGHIVPVVVAC